MFQSLQNDLSSIKSVKIKKKEKCIYFSFPTFLLHLLSSIAVDFFSLASKFGEIL